jgi:Rha family phage regulatory protein
MEDIVRKETMTSLEIAEVTGKRHDSVLRDIRNLLSQGVDAHNFVETSYTDKANRQQKCFTLTKKGCLILASGYDALLREKIINRWEELENQVRKSEIVMPNFSNPAGAARAWADQYERNLALEANNKELKEENQTLAPKGEYFDDLVARNLLTNFTKVAHQLNIKRKTFIEWLIRDKFIYRDQKNKLVPYAKYAHTYFHINDTKGKYSKWAGSQTLITPEGKEAFRLLYERRDEKLLDFKK